MNDLVKVDTSKFDELLLDVLFQACSVNKDLIDNQCISAYEEACNYLTEQGYLTTLDGRIYNIKEVKK